MGNLVAIVGRPNVGKSTLFNRFTESRKAIVDESSGVTRDRHYGTVDWIGRTFHIIDTGGYIRGSDDVFESEIRRQVEISIEECDIVIFMVDVTTGVTDLDVAVASLLRKTGKPIFLVANKVDNSSLTHESADFYSLGLGEIYNVSAMSGSGTGEILDAVVGALPVVEPEDISTLPKIAIVGQPNVGKSSLLNAILGEERTIVTPISGTTRDTIHTRFKGFGHDMLLIDTAGLRRKAKVKEDIEFYSVMRTIKAIEDCDVCIFMMDATEGIESQDINIFHLAERNKKGVMILVNKWDLMEKDTHSVKAYTESIKEKIAPFSDVPIFFTSIPEKQRIHKALEEAIKIVERRKQKIPTSKLNTVMLPFCEAFPPPSTKGKYIKIKYITQLPSKTPQFAFFCNLPQYIKEPYKNYIENKIRENFDFSGVPIEIFFRRKN